MFVRIATALALVIAAPAVAQNEAAPEAAPAPATTAADPAARLSPLGPSAPGIARAKPAGSSETSRNAPINGVLVLYGNERCPTNKDGAEVTVCVRRGAEEQFRIPKELREFEITPQNQAWAERQKGILNEGVGNTGIGSCSVVGPAGFTGCHMQQARQTRKENVERAKDEKIDLSPY